VKKHTPRKPYSYRRATPEIGKDAKGNHALLCPFCSPPHPLYPGVVAPCGTTLQIEAVQMVVRATLDNKKLVCAKCGKSGGKMTPFGEGFIHAFDCMPGAAMITESEFPPMGRFLAWLPEAFQNALAPVVGRAYPVQEVTKTGERTGKVLGYIIQKEKSGLPRRSLRHDI